MSKLRKALAVTALGMMLSGTVAAPAFADPDPKGKCNSGRGNNSETVPENDCDPGNSGGHNSGGD